MWKRSARYWGRMWLTNMGICAAAALFLMIFFAGGTVSLLTAENDGGLGGVLLLYPYYLMITVMFYLVVAGMGYFQVYVPVLVSMNATRMRAVLGVILTGAAMILGSTLLSALAWYGLGGSEGNMAAFLPAVTGAMCICGGFGNLLGVVRLKWGSVGTVLMVIVSALMGGVCGAAVSIFGRRSVLEMIEAIADAGFFWLAAAGAVFYFLSGVFSVRMLRKMEVRM